MRCRKKPPLDQPPEGHQTILQQLLRVAALDDFAVPPDLLHVLIHHQLKNGVSIRTPRGARRGNPPPLDDHGESLLALVIAGDLPKKTQQVQGCEITRAFDNSATCSRLPPPPAD